jgi:aldehyde dehydrogenase (NAD+)
MSKHARSAPTLPMDGVERTTAEGWTFPVRSPASGELLWQLPDAGLADADTAAQAAWRAFHETPWSTDTTLRAEALARFREALVEHSDDLALMRAAETGVPVAMRRAHLDAPVAHMLGERATEAPGVTTVITPATSPLAVAIEEVGRVLVAGGTVVLKPAPEAASAALELGRIALDILPRGVLNVVSTRDVDVAVALTLDHRVDEVSFTGSSVSGERVQVSGERAGKRVRLDLGGPRTIRAADDADLRAVVSAAALAVAANAGQGCRLPASVVVPAHRYAEALQAAVDAMDEVVVGDPLEPDTWCGPLRSPAARDRVRRYLSLAQSEGGHVALGGRVLERDGWWFAPTVVGGLAQDSRLVREEVLGPVLMVVADDPSARA